MILSVTFSKPSKNCAEILGKPFQKIKIKPVNKNSQISYFAQMFTDKQVFHKSFEESELLSFIETHGGKTFLQCNYKTENEEIIILGNKKGHVSKITKKLNSKNLISDTVTGQEKSAYTTSSDNSYNSFNLFKSLPENLQDSTENRKKRRLLPEGQPVPFLILLGIMTPEGKIISSKYDKFKQINRFLEFIDDIIDEVIESVKRENNDSPTSDDQKLNADAQSILPNGLINQNTNQIRPIRITDFGCGKSYLTFAVYYYLTEIKKIPVSIIGLDLKEDVINYCNTLANKMNFSNLSFEIGNIADYSYKENPDIIITLHACDTATDFALQYAVKHNAKAILSVPCCQHEVNTQLKNQNPALSENSAFSSLLKYGLIKERFSSLITDAIRADYLEKQNYKVQILEFIDMEHTPKNLLIRAVKKSRTDKESCEKAQKRIDSLTSHLHIKPTILS